MKFIEIVEGFSIQVDKIVSVRRTDDGSLTIETENREYIVNGDFSMLMEALQYDEIEKNNMEKLTTQFFGG